MALPPSSSFSLINNSEVGNFFFFLKAKIEFRSPNWLDSVEAKGTHAIENISIFVRLAWFFLIFWVTGIGSQRDSLYPFKGPKWVNNYKNETI